MDLISQLQYKILKSGKEMKIAPNEVFLAIFSLGSEGPSIYSLDENKALRNKINGDMEGAFTHLAIYSMVAITGGNNYIEGAFLLPFFDNKNYRVLLISKIVSYSSKVPIHKRYLQFAVLIPINLCCRLPSVTQLESSLLDIIEDSFPKSSMDKKLSPKEFNKIKMNIIFLLNDSFI